MMKLLITLFAFSLSILCAAQAAPVLTEDNNDHLPGYIDNQIAEQKVSTIEDVISSQIATQHADKAASVSQRPTQPPSHAKSWFYVLIGIATASAATLGFAIPAYLRIRRERQLDTTEPETRADVQEVVHSTLHRFGKKVLGRSRLSGRMQYALLEGESGHQWMVTTTEESFIQRDAWLITLNHAHTYFEVHHNEMRQDSVRSKGLSAPALFEALMAAHAHGPFRLSRVPHGTWRDISLR